MRKTLVVAAAAALAVAGSGAEAKHAALGLELVASGLSSPVYVAAPGSEPDRLYLVEQRGTIRVLVNGALRAAPFMDISGLVRSGGEQGLLSDAFHPDYAQNHKLYVDYTDRNGDTRVVEYRSNGSRVLPSTSRELLFVHQPYANHNGGQLQFGPDGYLYVGMGDGGSGGDPENRAQNLSSRLGKLLRIDVRTGKVRVAAYGLRNPWRFSFDRANGDLYTADVGQGTWEEIDYLRRARLGQLVNYGWARYEGRAKFKNGPFTRRGALVWPIAVYQHGDDGCSVTGGYVYRGAAVPAAQGRYFYGDYCSGRVWSLKVVRGRATGLRLEPFTVSSLSSFGEDAQGELYTVSLGGSVYRLVG